MNDKILRQEVLDELEFDPSFDSDHIGVGVEDGVVTLTGHVESYDQKVAAIAAARRVRGVHAIAEEIDVRYPSQSKTADDQIARRALDILKWNATVSHFPIDVLVQSGWVTLSGTTDWEFQRHAAEDCIRKLSGVVGVTNRIQLKPRLNVADIKGKIEAALKRHAELDAKAIRVLVKDGDCVVLEGRVDTLAEQRAAEGAAWSAPGVITIEDRLTVG
ncbi:MAG TPA: BON domain-containing protein [Bradyrhizobium sp.]|nr:BON domain-containing protein [Bradyrhizobium sp.]